MNTAESATSSGNDANTVLPAVNFTDFCKTAASLKEIKTAINFYLEEFEVEKVPEYFMNWTLKRDDSFYRNGIIITNKHSKDWETVVIINDNREYSFDAKTNNSSGNWFYLPKTFSEFISDCLREEDIELLFMEKAVSKIYGR